MKVTPIKEAEASSYRAFNLPFGLIGLPELKHFEVSPIEGSYPFLNLKAVGDGDFTFVALQPAEVIDGYEIVLNEEDLDALQISNPDEVLIYNLVTIHSMQPLHVTVNLAGPLVLNRTTMVGKQLVQLGGGGYSTRHELINERATA